MNILQFVHNFVYWLIKNWKIQIPDRKIWQNVQLQWYIKNEILTCWGAIIPGQLGPMSRDLFCSNNRLFTLTMSCWGTPSVIHTIKGISASMASMIAEAAAGGGTYITEAVAPVSAFA